jgi:hypothetical protein
VGVYLWSQAAQAYVSFRGHYGTPAGSEQTFPLSPNGPGAYEAQVVVFDDAEPLRFSVVETVAIDFSG